jgi:hypothetical protein
MKECRKISKVVPLFVERDAKLVQVDTVSVHGLSVLHKDLIAVRVQTDLKGFIALKQAEGMMTAVAAHISKLAEGRIMVPYSGNPKRRGKVVQLTLLFAREEAYAPSENIQRHISLDHHLDGRGEYMATVENVAVVSGYMDVLGDGVCYCRSNDWKVTKAIGFGDFSYRQFRNESPVVKGMFVFMPDWAFTFMANAFNLPEGTNGLVDAKTVKFLNGKTMVEHLDVFEVFEPIECHGAKLPVQALIKVPLVPGAHDEIADHFLENVEKMKAAFTSEEALKKFFLETMDVLLHKDDLDAEDRDALEDGLEAMTATRRALLTGLPIDHSEVLNSVIEPMCVAYLRSIRIKDGFTYMVLPDPSLKPGEITVPQEMRKMIERTSVDGRAVVLRSPCMGREMANAHIVGYTFLPVIFVTPTWWANRFNGDYDGDIMAVAVIGHMVDESIVNLETAAYGSAKKNKTAAVRTVPQAVASFVYSKLAITRLENLSSLLALRGDRGGAFDVGEDVQMAIDAAKFAQDPRTDNEIREAWDINSMETAHPAYRLMRGKLGDNKKERAMIAAALAVEARDRECPAVPWLDVVRKALPIIVAPNSRYANAEKEGVREKTVDGYRKALALAGRVDLLDRRANFESGSTLPSDMQKELYAGLAPKTMKRVAEAVPQAVTIARELMKRYQVFTDLSRDGRFDEAFELMRKTNTTMSTLEDNVVSAAMTYFFFAQAGKTTVRKKVGDRWRDTWVGHDPAFTVRSMRVLLYYPIRVGKYNLADLLKRIGYERKLEFTVV